MTILIGWAVGEAGGGSRLLPLGGEVAETVWYLSLPVGSEIYKEWYA